MQSQTGCDNTVMSYTSETWKSQGEAGLGLVDSASQPCHWESRFFPKVVKSTGSGANKQFGSESQAYPLKAVWFWTNDLTSLSLSFLCDKQDNNGIPSYGVVVNTKARVGKPLYKELDSNILGFVVGSLCPTTQLCRCSMTAAIDYR